MDVIDVLLVDDHEIVRSGLATFIYAFDDLNLVGEASNGKEAVQQCGKLNPDVVLMDLVMPEMNGADATRLIKERYPKIEVIALTSHKEKKLVEGVLNAGAIGFLLKDISADQLAENIRLANKGESCISTEASNVLIKAKNSPKEPGYDLTERERDVLKFMAKGNSNPEIAETLGIKRSTVKFHVQNILLKLDASSRTEAASIAYKYSIIESEKSNEDY